VGVELSGTLVPLVYNVGTRWRRSRDSVVSVSTRYGLEGLGIESRWGEIFHTYPDRLQGPPSLLYNGSGSFPGVKAAGV
jgi:hypothetical protein